MQLEKEDALKYYNEYIDFFETFLGGDITNYYRWKKRQRLIDINIKMQKDYETKYPEGVQD